MSVDGSPRSGAQSTTSSGSVPRSGTAASGARPVLITGAQRSYDEEHRARVKKYSILLAFRIPALVLAAADSAVMMLDAARGVEPQTLRLFEVARAREIPRITFVNKYDRAGMDQLEMLDHIESVLDITPHPLVWPVGIPGDFRGVIDRRSGAFQRAQRARARAQASGISDSTARRARASSLRLVSWVEVVLRPCGCVAARRSRAAWKAPTGSSGICAEEPTSFRASSGV